MAIKNNEYIIFESLIRKCSEEQMISAFYIIIHKIMYNEISEINFFFFINILFKYNINLYSIKNIKKTVNF